MQGADCEELNAAVEKTIARRQWSKAAGHFCGRGLESGVDYTVANKHVDKLRCAGLACEAGMLENIVTGGYYTRSRLTGRGSGGGRPLPEVPGREGDAAAQVLEVQGQLNSGGAGWGRR